MTKHETTATTAERLQFTKETLRALTSAELTLVAGGRSGDGPPPSAPWYADNGYAC